MGNPWSDDSGGWADQLYGSNPLSNNFNVQPLDSSGPTSPGISNPWSVKPVDYTSSPAATTGVQPPADNSSHGLFSNIWSGIVHGYDYGKGVLSGAGNALTGNNQNNGNNPSMIDQLRNTANSFMHPSQFIQHNVDMFKNIPTALMQGFTDPSQATHSFEQGIQSDANSLPQDNPFTAAASAGLKYGVGALNDPVNYIPVGKVFQGVKALSDVAGATPYIAKAADAVANSPVVNNAAVNGLKDIYGTLFKKAYGTMADTKPTMDTLGNTTSADQYVIPHKMADLSQAHGLTPEEMAQVPHVMDTGKTLETKVGDLVNPTAKDGTILSADPVKVTDIKFDNNGQKWIQTELGHSYFPENQIQHISNDRINQASKELSDLLSGGFDSAHGKVYGTDAELRNTHSGSAPSLQDLFAQKPGNQIREGAVGSYYPRRFNNTPEEVSAALEQYNGLQKGLSTNGVFNKAREFPTLQDAIDHGLKPEMNPYIAIGQRLAETSKAVHTDNAIKQLKYADVVKDAHEPGLKESTTNPFTSFIKNVTDPKTGEESSFINRSYMNSADQSYIQRALDPQGAKTTAENVLDKVGKYTGYDPTINLLKKASLALSPQVHMHNLIDNGMYLGGAKASDTLSTMGNLRKGIHDPDYEKALASGAISSELKGTGFADALRNQVAPENKNLFQKAYDGIKYGTHDALWDADKGLRTSLNKQTLEGGATAAEAADKTNKFLVNYKNTTPFEDSVMKRIFPFYSWMKGNMPLQAEQWYNNTPKQMLAHRSINALSQALSGNDDHNGKADTGLKASDGSHTMYDPYIASEDPVKALHDTPIPFLFNRMNPFIKMGLEEMTNKKYSPFPMTAAPDKQYLNKPEIRLSGPEAQDSGYNTRATIAHIANALNPVGSGVLGNAVGATGGDARSYIEKALGVNKKDKFGNDVDKPSATLPELLLPLTGGFTSRYNPDKEANSKAYSDKQNLKDDISFKKSRGEQVSKGEKKAANRKVVQ